MSSTTNNPYMTKSMNGIITLSDGVATTIENGTITTNTINLTNLNIDNIQGIAPADNITLFTNTTGNINLGGITTTKTTLNASNISSVATNDNYIKATRYASLIGENSVFINTNSLSVGTITIDAGSSTNINNGTGKPVNIASLRFNAGTIFANGISDITISPGTSGGVLKIAGGQQIEANNNANGFSICNNLTAGTFYLGNSTVGPSTTYTATNPYELVNYQTAISLIGGGSILGSNNIFTGTNEFQNEVNIGVGATSANTFSVLNNSSLPNIINLGGLQTINNIKGINININASSNGNVNIGTGSTVGNINIGNIGTTTNTILGTTINIGNSGSNIINIGSPTATTLNLRQPITPTYTYGANGTGVGASIGYVVSSSSTTALVINTTITQMLSFSIPDDGVWMITAQVRFQSNNATNNTSVQNSRAGIGSSSANYDYCSACLGDTTMLLTYNNNATKRYWEVPLVFIGRLAFGQSVSINAEGVSNNGLQAIYRSFTYCRIA